MGNRLKVTRTGSTIARPAYQETVLRGLGLKKLHQTRLLEDTPAVRGMITKVQHLVTWEVVSDGDVK